MYGGRVIDTYDQRIVNTFMEEYFGQFILDEFQKFYFYHDNNIHYDLPICERKEDYLSLSFYNIILSAYIRIYI